MRKTYRAGLRECLLEFVKSGRPLLGICLGMQLLFDESKENGVHPGLGILNGLVEAIPISDDGGRSLESERTSDGIRLLKLKSQPPGREVFLMG